MLKYSRIGSTKRSRDIWSLDIGERPGAVHAEEVQPVGEGLNLLEKTQFGRVGPVSLCEEVGVADHLDLLACEIGLDFEAECSVLLLVYKR